MDIIFVRSERMRLLNAFQRSTKTKMMTSTALLNCSPFLLIFMYFDAVCGFQFEKIIIKEIHKIPHETLLK